MLVNHEHKLIFVHIFRTGGTSVRFALREAGIEFEVVGDEHGKCPRHIFPEYYKFSIVRHPYDWLLSIWRLISHDPLHPFHTPIKHYGFTFFVKWYIDSCELEMPTYGRQVDFITDEKGLTVHDWFKLEEIDDLRYMLRRRLKREIKIQHLHKAPKRMTLELRTEPINRFFQRDFEEFDYETQ